MIRGPPRSPLFPYPTPFRSKNQLAAAVTANIGGDQGNPNFGQGFFRNLHILVAQVRLAFAAHRGQHASPAENLGLEVRSEEHTSELQSLTNLVCRLLLEKKN